MQNELLKQNYKIKKYNVFKVFEPKERVIMSLPFKDKIVQKLICDYILEPKLEPTFIYDNYASRKNKGTHFGLNRLEKFMHKFYRKNGDDGWFLKCDISKYFYSIDHKVLKKQLKKRIKNEKHLNLIFKIIDSTTNPGIPLGNQTSQFLALLYLSGMDHFIKEKLKIKYYGRYMDDFYLIHKDKEYLQYCLSEIRKYCDGLKLKLNNKTNIFPVKNGLDFLGFHTYLTETGKVIRKIRRKSKSNMKRKIKKYKKMYDAGEITKEKIETSFESWINHATYGNCYYLIKDMKEYMKKTFKEG